jgi:hypothetical protein
VHARSLRPVPVAALDVSASMLVVRRAPDNRDVYDAVIDALVELQATLLPQLQEALATLRAVALESAAERWVDRAPLFRVLCKPPLSHRRRARGLWSHVWWCMGLAWAVMAGTGWLRGPSEVWTAFKGRRKRALVRGSWWWRVTGSTVGAWLCHLGACLASVVPLVHVSPRMQVWLCVCAATKQS